jgi:hypothetical protein
MTDALHHNRNTAERPYVRELRDVAIAMRHLVASAEPAVVFSSLARACVPRFSDSCTVDIVEHERAGYRISYPRTPSADAAYNAGPVVADAAEAVHVLCTTIEGEPNTSHRRYFGVVTHSWNEYQPNLADAAIAQFLVDTAVAAVEWERLADLRTRR